MNKNSAKVFKTNRTTNREAKRVPNRGYKEEIPDQTAERKFSGRQWKPWKALWVIDPTAQRDERRTKRGNLRKEKRVLAVIVGVGFVERRWKFGSWGIGR
ncbi:protein kinase and PP2C-like domain-containing protein [Pyrus ussuriensis x Pyrus communis]|uniref:Protein kinase and PP2C-like domain-containing protein n=1 Tax=Pyrus ussuriensis x Pyrus communis TaxID=2448454 RepID=A0A5N5HXR8_9ROSA|nr:protein kinase and PP2C-like domain-containing protein [Pyrus ussuriensis x Pyrus communis]